MRLRTSIIYPIIGLVWLSVFSTAVAMYSLENHALVQTMRAAEWARVEAHHKIISDYIGKIATTMGALATIFKRYDKLKEKTAAFFHAGGFNGNAGRTYLKAAIQNLAIGTFWDDIIIADPSGKVIVRANNSKSDDMLTGWGVAEAMAGQDIVVTTLTDQGWEIRAVSPIESSGENLAVIVITRRLDDRFAHELSGLFDCKPSFGSWKGIFASALPVDHQGTVAQDLILQVLREKTAVRTDFDGKSNTVFYAPIQALDERFCLIVEKDTRLTKALVARQRRETLLLSLLMFVMISILAMVIALKLIRPIQNLKSKAQIIAKEIADEQLEDVKGNEVVNLVHVFNCMADAIKRHIAGRQAAETKLKQHRDQLEEQVKERTEHLDSLNKQLRYEINERINTEEILRENKARLEKALDELKRTQAAMIQSEKMASVGQLAAGVAHEINNPTGFVKSNLHTLAQYQEDINRLLMQYSEFVIHVKGIVMPEDDPNAISKRITNLASLESKIDIAFLIEDIPKLIQESKEGVERIQKIVTALKNFARPGETKLQFADINECLESTLKVVWNELKYNTTITKDYGKLPLVKCHQQKINQVFMNVLVNAAQAIEKKGEIRIGTAVDDGFVVVSIADTGTGIAPADLPRIFDPFYTTKEIGKGTGLGLHIALDIIRSYGGSIDVASTRGRGSTFNIRLPHSPADNQAL